MQLLMVPSVMSAIILVPRMREVFCQQVANLLTCYLLPACFVLAVAGKTGTATANVLLIKTSSVSCGSGMGSEGGQLPTPNGLAELAHTLSGDMTFEDMMFDNSSRRGSVSASLH